MIPFWADDRGASGDVYPSTDWDLLTVGGSAVPGLTEVPVVAERKADVREPAGKHGGRTTFHGRKVARFETRTRMWLSRQWEDFQLLVQQIFPNGGTGTPKPYDVQHPALSFAGVRSAAVESVAAPVAGSVDGERVVTIKWAEFSEQKKSAPTATKTPTAAETAARPEFSSSPTSAADGSAINYSSANQIQSLPSDDPNQSEP